MREEYIIFSMKLAGYLMQRGFVLKRLGKSNHKGQEKRNVFIFNKSRELLKACDFYNNELK